MARHRNNFSRGVSSTIGLRETLRQLREMGDHVVTAAKNALKQGADEVVADAKSRCPVKTGALKNSIRAEPNREETSYEIVADAEKDGVCYGEIVEFSPKINKPFLYPAMEQNQQQIYDKVSAALSKATGGG